MSNRIYVYIFWNIQPSQLQILYEIKIIPLKKTYQNPKKLSYII